MMAFEWYMLQIMIGKLLGDGWVILLFA